MVYRSLPEACMSARARKGHTMIQAAEAVGRSLRTWKSWESGEATPYAQHLIPLAEYTGVRLTDLVRLIQHEPDGASVASDATATNPTGRRA